MTTDTTTILEKIVTSLDDVREDMRVINRKVDRIGDRVSDLEADRARHTPARAEAEPEPDTETDGEDWQKVIKTAVCYKIRITTTRNGENWKILCYMRGQMRPASIIGWDGIEPLIEFMRDVIDWLALDHFAKESIEEAPQAYDKEGRYWGVEYDANFLVDWYRTKPTLQGKRKVTYVNIDGVYPL